MNPIDVMEGLKAALQTIPRLQVYDHIPSSVTPPCAVVGLGPFSYVDQGTAIDQSFQVTVFTSRSDDRQGQRKLAEYINPTGERSIKAAVDAALGLPFDGAETCDAAVVTGGEEIGVAEVAATSYHAVTFTVSVLG